jgi:hypothetical protein
MRTLYQLLFALICFAKPAFANTFPLVIQDGLLRPGETISVPVKAGGALDIRGFQFELHFDSTIFTIVGIIPSKLPSLTIENFTQPNAGILKGSWTYFGENKIKPGTLIFTLQLKVVKAALIHDSFQISNSTIQSEVYDEGNEAYDLSLAFSPPNGGNFQIQKSEIFNAQPNPTFFDVKIPIWLSTETQVTWSLFDVPGRRVFSDSKLLDEGAQILQIPADILQSTTTYVWEVRFLNIKKHGILVRI